MIYSLQVRMPVEENTHYRGRYSTFGPGNHLGRSYASGPRPPPATLLRWLWHSRVIDGFQGFIQYGPHKRYYCTTRTLHIEGILGPSVTYRRISRIACAVPLCTVGFS